MLVIANGAFKSGSTWQRNLIAGLIDFDKLPEDFQGNRNKSFINASRLSSIIKSPHIRNHDYIAKAHIFDENQIELLTSDPKHIKIFMIQRDIRDAIVSHYNHFINVRKIKPSFRSYYWTIGRYKAMQIIKYNRNWELYTENVFHSTFEKLKKDTPGELRKFANFLDVEISEEKIRKIIDDNNIEKIRKKSNRKWFFRKGEIGDHKNYLTSAIEKDLDRIQKRLGVFDKTLYRILFELRRKIS